MREELAVQCHLGISLKVLLKVAAFAESFAESCLLKVLLKVVIQKGILLKVLLKVVIQKGIFLKVIAVGLIPNSLIKKSHYIIKCSTHAQWTPLSISKIPGQCCHCNWDTSQNLGIWNLGRFF